MFRFAGAEQPSVTEPLIDLENKQTLKAGGDFAGKRRRHSVDGEEARDVIFCYQNYTFHV